MQYTARETFDLIRTRNSPYKERRENGVDGQPVYVGEADPGAAATDARWRIQKWSYTNGLLTSIDWASGNRDFDKVWDDRATYNYS